MIDKNITKKEEEEIVFGGDSVLFFPTLHESYSLNEKLHCIDPEMNIRKELTVIYGGNTYENCVQCFLRSDAFKKKDWLLTMGEFARVFCPGQYLCLEIKNKATKRISARLFKTGEKNDISLGSVKYIESTDMCENDKVNIITGKSGFHTKEFKCILALVMKRYPELYDMTGNRYDAWL